VRRPHHQRSRESACNRKRLSHLADQAVCTAQRGVDAGADADEAAGHGELQVVLLGVQRHDARADRPALHFARGTLLPGHNAGPDLDLVAHLLRSTDKLC
jgi:hypothetical protein